MKENLFEIKFNLLSAGFMLLFSPTNSEHKQRFEAALILCSKFYNVPLKPLKMKFDLKQSLIEFVEGKTGMIEILNKLNNLKQPLYIVVNFIMCR